MIEPDFEAEDFYPDDVVREILSTQPSGRHGICNFSCPERDVFIWYDSNVIPRGVLTLNGAAASYGSFTGDEFTIMVHPDWRRRGIATKLYLAACDFYAFDLDEKPMYSTSCAAWANAMMSKEAAYERDGIDLPCPCTYIYRRRRFELTPMPETHHQARDQPTQNGFLGSKGGAA